jgi:peptide/nickel transport system substrate-binding protein
MTLLIHRTTIATADDADTVLHDAVFGCTGTEDAQYQQLGWITKDPARAGEALRAAGYDGRLIVVMDPADNTTLHPGALVLADTLRRMGADVDLQAMDWSALVQRRASRAPPNHGGWNAFVTNATLTGIANPRLNTFTRHCEDASFGWPCDRRAPELIRGWPFENDPAARQRILKQLEAVHVETVTNVPLGQYRSSIAYRRSLKGLLPGPALFYWNTEKA